MINAAAAAADNDDDDDVRCLQHRSFRWLRPKSTQCKLSFLYSRIHRDRVLLIILYYNKTHERAGEIREREEEEEEESRSCPETQIKSLVEKLTCTILQDTSYNARSATILWEFTENFSIQEKNQQRNLHKVPGRTPKHDCTEK
jgi:hypothetical protein